MSALSEQRIDQVVAGSATDRARVRALVRSGQWTQAETDRDRLARYIGRHVVTTTPPGAEAIQGGTNELQAVRFLTSGAAIRRAVGYVEVTTATESLSGTGFLVSPRLFLANCHVIANGAAARGAVVTFDRELDDQGQPRPTTTFLLDPDRCALFSDEDHLDYALVALGERTTGTASPADLGYIALLDRDDKHAIGMPVNIIQHPRAWPKMVALRNNFLVYRTSETLLYETDTDEGSSGSPVLNDDWEVVALHHWGSPHRELSDGDGQTLPTNVNEGIRISVICADLRAVLAGANLTASQRELVSEALSYSSTKLSTKPGHVLGPPHARLETGPTAATQQEGSSSVPEANEVRLTLPLEITVRLGTTPLATKPASTEPAPVRVLQRQSEAVTIDLNYDNRSGYDEAFIAGHVVALPSIADAALAKQVAVLRAGVPNAASGALDYEHFTVKLNKSKRVAIFTATNIDGPTYLNVDRQTGRVADSEGDRWFIDTRVSASFFLGQDFYTGWSNLFDRGHLTRRSDPTWGPAATAERANADTFHFTNCSPQHWRFNESAKYWQGVERYVLENGLLENDNEKRLCVLQGPVFDDTIDRWADDVQIPSSFWKIVVWKGSQGLKSVGLVVDQLAIIDIQRQGGSPPQALPFVDVSHWRVPIATIEKRTGLSFGDEVRNGDTIHQPDQPAVGGEAAIRIDSFKDIAL